MVFCAECLIKLIACLRAAVKPKNQKIITKTEITKKLITEKIVGFFEITNFLFHGPPKKKPHQSE